MKLLSSRKADDGSGDILEILHEQSEHTGQAPSIAEHRPNRFELTSIHVTANGLEVYCVERGVYGSRPPPMTLEEGTHLGPHHIAYGREAADELERLFEAEYVKHESANVAVERHKAIQDKLDAQAALEKLNEQIDARRAELSALAAASSGVAGQLAQVQSIFAAPVAIPKE